MQDAELVNLTNMILGEWSHLVPATQTREVIVDPAQPQAQMSFAEKLEHLFNTVPPKRGLSRKHRTRDKHSSAELAEFVQEYTKGTCTRQYIDKLRQGKSPAPGADVLEAIAVFFTTPPAYFFNDELSLAIAQQLELANLVKEAGVDVLMLRELTKLDRADLPVVVQGMRATLRALRARREDGEASTVDDDPGEPRP